MERSVHDALCVVKRVLESQQVVAGGGAVEAALSIFLETLATSIVSRTHHTHARRTHTHTLTVHDTGTDSYVVLVLECVQCMSRIEHGECLKKPNLFQHNIMYFTPKYPKPSNVQETQLCKFFCVLMCFQYL